MPTIKIDGKELTVEDGVTILQAALENGIEIPHYCYHPALRVVGSCRLCLVEVDNSPKLLPACATRVTDGMEVRTQTEQVRDARRSILEFFLTNHPLDCPICDKAGECLLQDYTFKYGSAHSRFIEEKRVRPTKDLGGNILLYRNRCVMCTRCVRFFEEVVGEPYLVVEHRGYHSDISIFPGKELTHKMTGNIVEICPVGCLIDKDFLFHARVWNLTRTKSICPGCSAGCNIYLEHKDNRIYRIRSRKNMEVNTFWICDDGRYIYHRFEELDRITQPMRRLEGSEKLTKTTWQEAISMVHDRLALLKRAKKLDQVAVVGSAFASNEENYLLTRIFGDELGCKKFYVYAPSVEGEDETFRSGFTIRADKTPNRRGAELLLGKNSDFWGAIKKGEIKFLFFLGGNVQLELTDQQKELLKRLEFLVVQDVVFTEMARLANVVLPMGYFAESEGTYVNVDGRVQRFSAALVPPGDVKPGVQILLDLYRAFKPDLKMISAADVMNDLAANRSEFNGMSYFSLGDSGEKLR
jgi:NADH-quinone oxidoreductase subunit G